MLITDKAGKVLYMWDITVIVGALGRCEDLVLRRWIVAPNRPQCKRRPAALQGYGKATQGLIPLVRQCKRGSPGRVSPPCAGEVDNDPR